MIYYQLTWDRESSELFVVAEIAVFVHQEGWRPLFVYPLDMTFVLIGSVAVS